jgi:hypothetical protein
MVPIADKLASTPTKLVVLNAAVQPHVKEINGESHAECVIFDVLIVIVSQPPLEPQPVPSTQRYWLTVPS